MGRLHRCWTDVSIAPIFQQVPDQLFNTRSSKLERVVPGRGLINSKPEPDGRKLNKGDRYERAPGSLLHNLHGLAGNRTSVGILAEVDCGERNEGALKISPWVGKEMM